MQHGEQSNRHLWISILGGILSIVFLVVSLQSTHTAHVTALADAAAKELAEEIEREAARTKLKEQQREREYYYQAALEKEAKATDTYQSAESVTTHEDDTDQSGEATKAATEIKDIRDYVTGTYCRTDGQCVTIASNLTDATMSLDTTASQQDNPLPNGVTHKSLVYHYQGVIPDGYEGETLSMVTSYSIIPNEIYCDGGLCLPGEVRYIDYSGKQDCFHSISGVNYEFAEDPTYVFKVMTSHSQSIEGIDWSDPPRTDRNYLYTQTGSETLNITDKTVYYEQ